MPIDRLLQSANAEKIKLLNRSFDFTLRSLGVADRNDPLCEMLARKLIEIELSGISDPKEAAKSVVHRIGLR